MRKRITVIAVEQTNDMSENDLLDLFELLELLSKKYHFKWAQTGNEKWLETLIKEMREAKE